MRTSQTFTFDRPEEVGGVTLVVIVMEVVSYRPKTGEIAFKAALNPTSEVFDVRGRGEAVLAGEVASVEGRWQHDAAGVLFLSVTSVAPTFDSSAYGATESLVHRRPALLKAKEAQALRERLADQIPAALDDEAALVFSGLDSGRARQIVAYRKTRRASGRLLCFLQANGVSHSRIERILATYETDAARVVFTDPWRLVREIDGIGFATADRIARATGARRNQRARVTAGLTALIEEYVNEGNVCIPQTTLVQTAADKLGVSTNAVASLIEPMAEAGSIVVEKVRNLASVYLPAMHAIEIETARDLAGRIDREAADFDVEALIDAACAAAEVTLHENQRRAVAAAMTNRIAGMTGGPGSGKTMTIKVIIEAMKILSPQAAILLAAPTGRASQRLAESTGMDARTIHKLLEWSPADSGFLRNKTNPLECDLLVVDEFSMVDARLARDLLRALPPQARLVIVGDSDQLPSVGAGEVLADVIGSGVVPVIRLTKIFRQQSGSSIARVAAKVNAGQMPDLPTDFSRDVVFRPIDEPEEIPSVVDELVKKHLPKLGFEPMEDAQVITPGHNHFSGTQNLNRILQETLNPHSPFKQETFGRGFVFRLGDRVMQTRTSYELGVFNGEIGRIIELDAYRGGLTVMFGDRTVDYTPEETNGLTLAYASTVHRSQGSEYPVVIAIASFEHANMLRRRLLYTAITRARKLLVLVGQKGAVAKAVKNDYDVPRYTGLRERLREQHALRS